MVQIQKSYYLQRLQNEGKRNEHGKLETYSKNKNVSWKKKKKE